MKLHLFNPDTDLALACDDGHYIAPVQVRDMARDLALLPLWYAGAGGKVWVTDRKAMDYASQMCLLFGLDAEAVADVGAIGGGPVEAAPWGWNRTVRQSFLKLGVHGEDLPSDGWLDVYRRLASRQTSAALLHRWPLEGSYGGEAEVLYTLDECRAYADGHGAVVFKAPWSSSGKGLCWCRADFSLSAGWCGRTLREQGAVVASPIYNKVEDLALEFMAGEDGRMDFLGYSSFLTDGYGRYQGNRVLSADAFEAYMTRYVARKEWERLRKGLIPLLAVYAEAGYRGPLGVDMMVCRREDGGFFLYPMVEVNLRMNMGIVALRLAERVLGNGLSGRFDIVRYPSVGALREAAGRMLHEAPPQVREGRLVDGTLPLVPVTSESRFMAVLTVTSGQSESRLTVAEGALSLP